jgi:hypothetical protein
VRRFRAYYGAPPLHLLAIMGSFVIVAAAVVNWFRGRAHIGNVLVWYLACLLIADLVLIPLGWALDRIASWLGTRAGRLGKHPSRGAGWTYVRVPAMLSGLLLIVFLPLIARLGDSTYRGAAAMAPSDRYLVRWRLASAVMFACSGLAYVARLAKAKARRGPVRTAPLPEWSRSQAATSPLATGNTTSRTPSVPQANSDP